VQELIITIRKAGIMSSSTEHSEIPNALDQGATLKNYFAYERRLLLPLGCQLLAFPISTHTPFQIAIHLPIPARVESH